MTKMCKNIQNTSTDRHTITVKTVQHRIQAVAFIIINVVQFLQNKSRTHTVYTSHTSILEPKFCERDSKSLKI